MAGPKSFRDPVTNRLKAVGFMAVNALGDLAQQEIEGFNLDPRDGWQWNGTQWVRVLQAVLDTEKTQSARLAAQGTLAAVDDATAVVLRAIVLVTVDQLNALRAAVSPALPPITPAQARAAILAKVQAGLADS
jgi:hypothetical protein